MTSIVIEKLKNLTQRAVNEGKNHSVILNLIKEELQYLVLDFIYNHPEYAELTMYGGTLLRIGYELPRMSEDLDFQTTNHFNLVQFEKDLIKYFHDTYLIDIDLAIPQNRNTKTGCIYIRFPKLMKELGLSGYGVKNVLRLRFDINYLDKNYDLATDYITVIHGAVVFNLKTYTISTLMASKIAAILLRGSRNVGQEIVNCKPRDVYDLLWYMDPERQVIPDLRYLNIILKINNDPRKFESTNQLFVFLESIIMQLDDKFFDRDLTQFFYNQQEFLLWYKNWKLRFQGLLKGYQPITVAFDQNKDLDLVEVFVGLEASTRNRYFHFYLSALNTSDTAQITFVITDYWYMFEPYKQSLQQITIDLPNLPKTKIANALSTLDLVFCKIFYRKLLDYIVRNNGILPKKKIITRLIRSSRHAKASMHELQLDCNSLLSTRFEDLL